MFARSAPLLARTLAVLALLVAAVPGCARERAAAEPPDSVAAGAVLDGAPLDVVPLHGAAPAGPKRLERADGGPPQVGAAQVTPAQFRGLRWLVGSWRGRMGDGTYFYERYAVANDSTVVMSSFGDSTFARATRTDSVVLRAGQLRFDRATAVRVDSAGVDFVANSNGTSSFLWTPKPPGWTATLRGTHRDGRPYTVVYEMEPFTPPGG